MENKFNFKNMPTTKSVRQPFNDLTDPLVWRPVSRQHIDTT
jgi:hypothetical protein